MNQHPIWKHIDENADRLRALSDNVWAVPETCYGEHKSVALHIEELEAQGFRVEKEAAGIPTAVIGEAGEGGPVVGFLGEYDALAELSQVADLPEQQALETGGQWPWVWSQHVGICRHVGGNRPEKLVRGNWNTGARALLWLSRGRRGIGQVIHGETWGV
jgi:hypothetical protein